MLIYAVVFPRKQFKHILIHNILPKTRTFKCGANNCISRNYSLEPNLIQSTTFHINYKMQNRIKCSDLNGIYLIQCSLCKKQHVGSTKNKFNKGQSEHGYCIKNNKSNLAELYRHFSCCGKVNNTDDDDH